VVSDVDLVGLISVVGELVPDAAIPALEVVGIALLGVFTAVLSDMGPEERLVSLEPGPTELELGKGVNPSFGSVVDVEVMAGTVENELGVVFEVTGGRLWLGEEVEVSPGVDVGCVSDSGVVDGGDEAVLNPPRLPVMVVVVVALAVSSVTGM
jgi:hypothetical protein